MPDNKSVAASIVKNVGGKDNVSFVTNCATRLRLTIKDKSLVDDKAIKAQDGVVGTQWSGNQYQIIVGLGVGDLYDSIKVYWPDAQNLPADQEDEEEKQGGFATFLSLVVSIFQPLLPVLAGSGLIRGLAILAANAGILSDQSTTYQMLTLMTGAIFYFLPFAVAFTTAKRFDTSPIMALVVMGTLLQPDFVALVQGAGGNTVDVFGLPIPVYSYSGSVLAPIFSVWVQSLLDHWLHKKMPHALDLSVTPMIILFVMSMLTMGVIGPICSYVSIALSGFVDWLTNINQVVTGAVVGGIWNILIMFGVHWAPNTIVVIPQIAKEGQSSLIAYAATANFGMAGAALAVFVRSKDSELRNFCISSMVSVFLSGIVEPAIYGIGVKFRTPLVAGCLGAACGGAFMGAFGVVGYSFVFGGLTTIPAFAGPTLWAYLLGVAIAFVGGFAFTLLFGVRTANETEPADQAA